MTSPIALPHAVAPCNISCCLTPCYISHNFAPQPCPPQHLTSPFFPAIYPSIPPTPLSLAMSHVTISPEKSASISSYIVAPCEILCQHFPCNISHNIAFCPCPLQCLILLFYPATSPIISPHMIGPSEISICHLPLQCHPQFSPAPLPPTMSHMTIFLCKISHNFPPHHCPLQRLTLPFSPNMSPIIFPAPNPMQFLMLPLDIFYNFLLHPCPLQNLTLPFSLAVIPTFLHHAIATKNV